MVAFADDINLLEDSLQALEDMQNIIEECEEFNISSRGHVETRKRKGFS